MPGFVFLDAVGLIPNWLSHKHIFVKENKKPYLASVTP